VSDEKNILSNTKENGIGILIREAVEICVVLKESGGYGTANLAQRTWILTEVQ
jgi:hypothetical protein